MTMAEDTAVERKESPDSGSGGSGPPRSAPEKQEVAGGPSCPGDLAVKHPLENSWTLWYFKNDKSRNWSDNLVEVTSFGFVEDFWAIYNHIQTASQLSIGCDYSLFKQGVKPMWEDDRNKDGGRWIINVDRKQRNTDLDRSWLEIVLCLIGEAFDEDSDDVCGAVVNIRPRGDKLAVWTRSSQNREGVMNIGRRLKERLNISAKFQIQYETHRETATKTGSMAKSSYTV